MINAKSWEEILIIMGEIFNVNCINVSAILMILIESKRELDYNLSWNFDNEILLWSFRFDISVRIYRMIQLEDFLMIPFRIPFTLNERWSYFFFRLSRDSSMNITINNRFLLSRCGNVSRFPRSMDIYVLFISTNSIKNSYRDPVSRFRDIFGNYFRNNGIVNSSIESIRVQMLI